MCRISKLDTGEAKAVPMGSGRALKNASANQRFSLSSSARVKPALLATPKLTEGGSEVEWVRAG
jgi:hypothetical protein